MPGTRRDQADPAVARVRSFNRTVSERIGALHDGYLARDRSLGESRLLWEIGPEGCEVRRLRARLGLDSGYVSRLLRALAADGLVTVESAAGDRRVRTATLTTKGRAERAILDRRSDDLARSLLLPLAPEKQKRLIAAMAKVERLLTVPLVEFVPVDPDDRRARHCLDLYFAELDRRFDLGFTPSASTSVPLAELRAPTGLFLVALLRAEPVACGGLRFNGTGAADIKRMWVAPELRGSGLGRLLLGRLEREAAVAGASAVRLETNRTLGEAIALYRSSGYREVPPFNDETYAHHWFEKELAR